MTQSLIEAATALLAEFDAAPEYPPYRETIAALRAARDAAVAEQAQPVGEVVAFERFVQKKGWRTEGYEHDCVGMVRAGHLAGWIAALASQPPAQEPARVLTDEQIRSFAIEALPTAFPFDTRYEFSNTQLLKFARSILDAGRRADAALAAQAKKETP